MLEQEIADFKGHGKANRTTLNLESGAAENSLISHSALVWLAQEAGTHEECVCGGKPGKGKPELGTP